jgi:hypothetical protein
MWEPSRSFKSKNVGKPNFEYIIPYPITPSKNGRFDGSYTSSTEFCKNAFRCARRAGIKCWFGDEPTVQVRKQLVVTNKT